MQGLHETDTGKTMQEACIRGMRDASNIKMRNNAMHDTLREGEEDDSSIEDIGEDVTCDTSKVERERKDSLSDTCKVNAMSINIMGEEIQKGENKRDRC